PLQSCHEEPDNRRDQCGFEGRKGQEANYKERGHHYRWTEVGNKIQCACEHTPKEWIRQPNCRSQSHRDSRETEIYKDEGAEILAHLIFCVIEYRTRRLPCPVIREEASNVAFDFVRVQHPKKHGKKEEQELRYDWSKGRYDPANDRRTIVMHDGCRLWTAAGASGKCV